MKRQLTIALGLAVLSTSAFASKARMQALGQGTGGSQYVDDTRNAFLNPASINNMKDYVIMEWGIDNSTADGATAPNAEGGFFREMGNFAYGVYLGNESASHQNRVAAAETAHGLAAGSFADEDNKLDLFFAGDAGVQWGVNLGYSNNKKEQNTGTNNTSWEVNNSSMDMKLGVIAGAIDGFVHYTLKAEAEGSDTATTGNNDKWEDDGSMSVGAGYSFGDNKAFARYDAVKDESVIDGTAAGKNTNNDTTLTLGFANNKELNDKARLISAVTYSSASEKQKLGAAAESTRKTTGFGLALALEADAASWLTLRGGLSSTLFGTQENPSRSTTAGTVGKKKSQADTTTVVAGATLNFGNLKVDGMIGNDNGGAGTVAGGSTTSGGILRTDSLMSRVAVHYWF